MKKSLSREDARKKIESFFSNIQNKTPEEIKKIKRLAMSYKIKLGEKRKLFCQKCLSPLTGKIRIKKGFKIIKCQNCGNIMRRKLKTS